MATPGRVLRIGAGSAISRVMTRYRGAFTALVTPFADGKVDVATLRALVERQIEGGIHGLVPCGTTGESVTLDKEETETVIRTVVEQAKGRVPVIAGVGTNDTRKSIGLAELAKKCGADGLLIVVPYYNKPTQAGLEAHFRALLSAAKMPAMLYNIPGRTGIDLALDTLARLADVEHVVAIKEATGNVVRAQQILARCGDRFDVLSGDDAITLPMMASGGSGVVSVTSNLLPGPVSRVATLMLEGKLAEARELHMRLVEVHEAMFIEANPGPVKGLMARAGLLKPEVRLPMAWPEPSTVERAAAILDAAGFKP